MQFDTEGHVVITPREWQERLEDRAKLTREAWLVGTPWAFATYANFREFVAFLADRLGVHPNNVAVRGSTKVGFSISPKPDKIWVAMRPDSDLDLAIVDPDYYHFFDREIRAYERRLGSRCFRQPEYEKFMDRRENRKFYVYRYLDMPDIGCVHDHKAHLAEAPLEQCCGNRPLSAFIYPDWWSVQSRCEHDLWDLRKALERNNLPAGVDVPRPFA
jgi:hypothetical protein